MPSITLVFVAFGAVINKSKTYLPADKFAVFAAVIDSVISPFEAPVTIDVIAVFDVA
jgi:hypothetical protein